ncbi:hypothetical protein QM905_01125, partial [Streptococcus salivarius]|uniref:hypothetical protein n=1 Tax=Streptococcus salivarius TaxID=1304 RepID=UPI0039C2DB84
ESDIRAILNGFKFDESMWEMPISDLSGGQNTRLALAKMLLEKLQIFNSFIVIKHIAIVIKRINKGKIIGTLIIIFP